MTYRKIFIFILLSLFVFFAPKDALYAQTATANFTINNAVSGNFTVGTNWTLRLTTAPAIANQPVWVCLRSSFTVEYCTPANQFTSVSFPANTDIFGSWTGSGIFDSSSIGNWVEYIKVGASQQVISNNISFNVIPAIAPNITTSNASNVTATTATLNGSVNGNNLSTSAWFEYGTNSNNLNNPTLKNSYGTGAISYNYNIAGLTQNTTYYFRAVAQNSQGIVYGNILSFNTSIGTTLTMSGALTPASSSCVIASGQNSCNISFSWSTTNPVGTSAITSTAGTGTVATGNSGSSSFSIPFGTKIFYLYNNAILLDSKTITATCVSGTTWNGTSCQTQTASQPTVTISANPTSVSYNGTSTITWSSTNSTSCTATGGANSWAGTKATSGSFATGALTTNTTYTITCSDGSVSSSASSATVTVGSQTGSQASVTTNSASNTTISSATLNGLVNGNNLSTNAWFEYGTSSSFGYSTPQNSFGTGSSNYSYTISGLIPNTNYYFRAVAENSQGRVYGNMFSFATSVDSNYCNSYYNNCYNGNYNNNGYYNGYYNNNYNNQPSVTTNSATNVSDTSATLNGSISGNGLYTSAWFAYGTNNSFGYTTPQSSYGSGYTNYNYTISNLIPNTTYTFRAVAQNSQGIVYGNVFSFTTSGVNANNSQNSSLVPTTTTTAATDVSKNSAQLNSFISNTTNNSANAWFEWGTSTNLGNKTPTTPIGTLSSVKHASIITGLAPGTIYFFRVVVENSAWRNNGSILSFTTNETQNTVMTVHLPDTSATIATTPKTTAVTTASSTAETTANASSSQEASVIKAGSFLPANLFGWLLLLILLLILILIGKYLYGQFSDQE